MCTKEKFMLIDLVISNYKDYGSIEEDINSYIDKNEYLILDDYIEADEKNVLLISKKNVIEEFLKKQSIAKSLESYNNVIASGSLKEISGKISNCKIDLIIRELSLYGNWFIHKDEDIYHLVNHKKEEKCIF